MKSFILMLPVSLFLIGVTIQVLQPIGEVVSDYYFNSEEMVTYVIDEETGEPIEKNEAVVLADEKQKVLAAEATITEAEKLSAASEQIETEPEEKEVNSKVVLPENEQKVAIAEQAPPVTPINPDLHQNKEINQANEVMESEQGELQIHDILHQIKQDVNEQTFQVESVQIEQAEDFLIMVYQNGLWRLNNERTQLKEFGDQILRVRATTRTHRYEFKVNLKTGEVISVVKTLNITKENKMLDQPVTAVEQQIVMVDQPANEQID